MHVCICYHKYPPINGGVEFCIQKISAYLIKRGHKVTILCSDKNKTSDKNEEIINGARVIYVKSYFDFLKVPFAPLYLWKLSKITPDLIHTHGTMPGYSDIAIIYAKFKRIPSLLSYKFDGNAESFLGQQLANIYNYTINKLVVRLADKITSTGQSYADTSPVLKSVLNKVTIIPNGVDLKRFNNKLNIKKTEGILPTGKKILWVGRFVKYKGLEYLIRSMKQVNNAKLIIVGSGKLEVDYKRLVKKENLSNKIVFLGHINNKDLPSLYKQVDIYILSSITRGENFGMSILEAMACGIPVIASDLSGVRELVSGKVGILVPPKNSNEIAKKINYLLCNKDIAKKMSVAGIKKAKDYSWTKVSHKYFLLYSKLLNQKKYSQYATKQ